MKKSTDSLLLTPGESGWEIWTAQAGSGYSLHSASTTDRASELTDLPAGDIVLLFPVKEVTAVPMRVAIDDEAMFPDLAALHAERLGLRPDPLAGQLTDLFVIAREPENSALVSVLLRAPAEGEMPLRGPKGFDISPRAFPLEGAAIAVWKEFGRWVFSVHHQGNLVYCQATSISSTNPDDELAREIKLALIQLSIQGIEIEPSRIVVWTSIPGATAEPLGRVLRAPVEIGPKPTPVRPDPLSKLLPADVRAARREAAKKRNLVLGIAAVAVLYLGLLGWFGYGLWRDKSETSRLTASAKAAAPEGERYTQHVGKWEELADVVDLDHSPVDILKRIADCIPPSSGLRLKTADISAGEVKLIGEAPQLPAVNSFSLNLKKNRDLARFEWQLPEPNQSVRGWEFVFSGEIPKTQ